MKENLWTIARVRHVLNNDLINKKYEMIFGRKEATEYVLWDMINAINEGEIGDRQKIGNINILRECIPLLTGLSLEELKNSNPEDIESKIKETTEDFLMPYMYHEFGHAFSFDVSVIPYKQRQILYDRDEETKIKLNSAEEIFADTFKFKELNGALAHIESLEDKDKRKALFGFFLSRYIIDKKNHFTDRESGNKIKLINPSFDKMKELTPEFNYELWERYCETENPSIIREAREIVLKRSGDLVMEMMKEFDLYDD